ncbi:MAG: hypothetical protein K8H74_13230 [Notoacmeibacter sp.]|nr:hypothetical protein [Notoacmeibacter sp.]
MFAYLTGITVSGLSASVLELAFGARARFATPFVSRGSVARSLLVTAVAGPVMLFNESLDAWRASDLRPLAALGAAIIANIWVLASGILTIQLLQSVGRGVL